MTREERLKNFCQDATTLAANLRAAEVEHDEALAAIHAADSLVEELGKLLDAAYPEVAS